MREKKKAQAFFLAIAFFVCSFSAYIVFAAGGSQEDPIVSLSYLTDVFLPDVLKQVDAKITASGGGGQGSSGYTGFKAIELKKDQILKGSEGTELILRSGEAIAVADGGNGLPDITSGVDLAGGVAVEKNHAYIVPRSDGRGVRMVTDGYLMVKGPYEIADGTAMPDGL